MYAGKLVGLTSLATLAALVAALGLTTSAAAHYYGRQYYGGWNYYSGGYYYCTYYYQPSYSYSNYCYNYCIYYPSSPSYVYYYNPYNGHYWGRFDLKTKGYSLLAEGDRKGQLKDIPESAFPAEGAMPPIPDSKDKVAIDEPPDLPKAEALKAAAGSKDATTPNVPEDKEALTVVSPAAFDAGKTQVVPTTDDKTTTPATTPGAAFDGGKTQVVPTTDDKTTPPPPPVGGTQSGVVPKTDPVDPNVTTTGTTTPPVTPVTTDTTTGSSGGVVVNTTSAPPATAGTVVTPATAVTPAVTPATTVAPATGAAPSGFPTYYRHCCH